jgi:proliferating cell nuclear antigen
MKLKSIQASAVRSTFEVLKDILNDVNVYFDTSGVRILTLDTAKTALIDLYLNADNFEEYDCPHDVVAGINISNTFKLLKSISNNDTITMEITTNDKIDIKIENEMKKSCTKFKLKLLDIDEDQIEIPDVKMSVITTLPSTDFQRICRDMNNFATEVNISRSDDNLIVKCEGDFASQETIINCKDDHIFKGTIGGLYSLKYLNLFTKATGMCSSVQLMQEESNRFLVLKYNIANLGEIKFFMATKIEEE